MKVLLIAGLLSALELVPPAKELEIRRGVWNMPEVTALVLPMGATPQEEAAAQTFIQGSGLPLVAVHQGQHDARNALLIGEWGRQPAYERFLMKRRLRGGQKLPPGGYFISVWGKGAAVIGADPIGTFHGLQTLQQLARQTEGVLPQLEIRDWPTKPVRAAYLTHLPEAAYLQRLALHKVNLLFFAHEMVYTPEAELTQAWAAAAESARLLHMGVAPVVSMFENAMPLLYAAPEAAEGAMAEQRSVLRGTETVILSNSNIIETAEHPIRVEVSGVLCALGVDYSLQPGDLQAPFNPINRPWMLRRLPGGSIPSGATASITYTYVPQHAGALCPQAPEAWQQLERLLPVVSTAFHPAGIHWGGSSLDALNRDHRCRALGQSDAEILRLALERLLALQEQAAPGVTAYFAADAFVPGSPHALSGTEARLPEALTLLTRVDADQAGGRGAWDWIRGQDRPFLVSPDVGEADEAPHWVLGELPGTPHAQGVVLKDPAPESRGFRHAVGAAW